MLVHRNLVNLNPKLAEALNLLKIGEVRLQNDIGEEIKNISPREHAKTLFTYLNMAGYLNDALLEKAVDYLDASKAFTCDKETVLNDLKKYALHQDQKDNLMQSFLF